MAGVKRNLDRALDLLNRRVERYVLAAVAAGREAPDGPTARGLDTNQLQRKLTSYIVAKLSEAPAGTKPVLRFDGAPEARKYVRVHGLPEL